EQEHAVVVEAVERDPERAVQHERHRGRDPVLLPLHLPGAPRGKVLGMLASANLVMPVRVTRSITSITSPCGIDLVTLTGITKFALASMPKTLPRGAPG